MQFFLNREGCVVFGFLRAGVIKVVWLFYMGMGGRFYDYFCLVILVFQWVVFLDWGIIFVFVVVLVDLSRRALIDDERFVGNFMVGGVFCLIDVVEVGVIVEEKGFFDVGLVFYCYGVGFDYWEVLCGVDDLEERVRSVIFEQVEFGYCGGSQQFIILYQVQFIVDIF